MIKWCLELIFVTRDCVAVGYTLRTRALRDVPERFAQASLY